MPMTLFRITDEGIEELSRRSIPQTETDITLLTNSLEKDFDVQVIAKGNDLNDLPIIADAICISKARRPVVVCFERPEGYNPISTGMTAAKWITEHIIVLEKLYEERYGQLIEIDGNNPIVICMGQFSIIHPNKARKLHSNDIQLYRCTVWEEKWFTMDALLKEQITD